MAQGQGSGAEAPERWGRVVALVAVIAAAGWVFRSSATASALLHLLPGFPLVVAIAAPAAPLTAGVAGVAAAAVALVRLGAEGGGGSRFLLLGLAFAATTTYAVLGALRQRRLERERAAAAAALAAERHERSRLERLALFGRLAAGVAHELANPLSAARANVAAAEDRLAAAAPQDGELPEILADLRASLTRMRRTVEDLRTFAREDASDPEVCDVAELLGDAARLGAGRAPEAELVLELPPGLPPVRVERSRALRALVWVLADAAGALGQPAACQLLVTARAEGAELVVALEGRSAPPGAAEDDEVLRGVALALAREDLVKLGGGLRREVVGGASRLVVHLPVER